MYFLKCATKLSQMKFIPFVISLCITGITFSQTKNIESLEKTSLQEVSSPESLKTDLSNSAIEQIYINEAMISEKDWVSMLVEIQQTKKRVINETELKFTRKSIDTIFFDIPTIQSKTATHITDW